MLIARYLYIQTKMKMLRIQAAVTFGLLLASAQQCHGFVATKTPRSTGTSGKLQTQPPLPPMDFEGHSHTFVTQLDLYSAQFTSSDSPSISSNNVNNRHAAKDYLYNMLSMRNSTVLREIKNPVMAVLGWSTLVSVVHAIATRHAPAFAARMCVSSVAHSFLVSSIGLLLVFRTNSAYQRFYVSTNRS